MSPRRGLLYEIISFFKALSTFSEVFLCYIDIWFLTHSGYSHDGWSTEAVCNIIGASLFVLNVQMKLLQVCGPLLMVIILQLPLCLYELQGSMVYVDDRFLSQNVILPLPTSLHNGIHFFFISGILSDCVGQCLTVICHWMPLLSKM